jgi:hypothetical protein
MELNTVENYEIKALNNKYSLVDIPGHGFYRSKIIEQLLNSKLIILFIDSSDK